MKTATGACEDTVRLVIAVGDLADGIRVRVALLEGRHRA